MEVDHTTAISRQVSTSSVPFSPNEYRNELFSTTPGSTETAGYSEIVEVEEQKSEVYFRVSDNEESYAGFDIHSTRNGHIVRVTEPDNHIVKNFYLRDGDRIIGFDQTDIRHYEHGLILESIKDLFNEPKGTISLIIERNHFEMDDEILEQTLLEIRVEFEFLPRGPGKILKVCAYVLKTTFRRFRPVRNVEYKGSDVYLIRSFNDTGHFLSVTQDGKLTMEVLDSYQDQRFQFIVYHFHGLRRQQNDGDDDEDVFLCTIQSNIPDKKRWICTTASTNVKLTGPSKLEFTQPEITRADCRFFKITKSRNGSYIFESLENEDAYMSWKHNRIRLKIFKQDEKAFLDTYPELQFELCSLEEFSNR